ncbi:MAG: hypothetical protein RL095_455 [Verrucomicrobiota bacterium]|jgi:hypothetical protein
MKSSVEVRQQIEDTLRLDLVGPDNEHPFAKELIPESPTRWYLCGFLMPKDTPAEQRSTADADDEIDSAPVSPNADDAGPMDRGAGGKSLFPASFGLSLLLPEKVKELEVQVDWGDYHFEGEGEAPADDGTEGEGNTPSFEETGGEVREDVKGKNKGFRRHPQTRRFSLKLNGELISHAVPDSGGLRLEGVLRSPQQDWEGEGKLPKGVRSLSLFLVNERDPTPERRYQSAAYQVQMRLRCATGFVPRPDLRDGGDDQDQRIADIQYRDQHEYGVGHGCAVEWEDQDGVCREVRSCWIPRAEVERVEPNEAISGAVLGMEALADLKEPQALASALRPLATAYGSWIEAQASHLKGFSKDQKETAAEMLAAARSARSRMEAGIELLVEDGEAREAFWRANLAMAQANRQRNAQSARCPPAQVKAPQWRPFQLAFILMNLRGLAKPEHDDRERVDLLFFPTGGGKTEAYLGLAAFNIVLRRLRHQGGVRGCGMTVLMRYTLRLLTLDQLGRASGLVCALELQRRDLESRGLPATLGTWPFEIGLWVGSAATPNRLGHQGYNGPGADETAHIKASRFNRDSKRHQPPVPMMACPWCGTEFNEHTFRMFPNAKTPSRLNIHCVNGDCPFSGDHALPLVAVDEPLYRRLPCFVIATVDKFAALPWTGEAGKLFGQVDSYDADGFYGPSEPKPKNGKMLDGPLPPPELIIQDELHLISGPLGTIAGLYETTIEELCRRPAPGWKPKIIASTATVRRAQAQIQALFGRAESPIFPPPGLNRRDSFFALTRPAEDVPARLYLGIAAQGRSFKVVLMRSYLCLLGAAMKAYNENRSAKDNPADPYMTLLGYFNSLRELGGSRRIVEDEVRSRLALYARKRRLDPEDKGLFDPRALDKVVQELTSRVKTHEVAATKDALAKPAAAPDSVPVALATNMISVGLDITRLGLMVVLGQPKTSSEYIQSTSRVGRDARKPGLVLTLLNLHRPRDRSHYERFGAYHASFYRSVEATSVTPFSPRALDRALAPALVGLCRQGFAELNPANGAERIAELRTRLSEMARVFAARAASHRQMEAKEAAELERKVLNQCESILDDWCKTAEHFGKTATRLQYQQESHGQGQRLLRDFLDPELKNLTKFQQTFKANRSMRDVDAGVGILVDEMKSW